MTKPMSQSPATSSDAVMSMHQELLTKLTRQVGKTPEDSNERDWFVAASLVVRDRIADRWLATRRVARGSGGKRVYYLSLEFLIGRLLSNSLGNLGITETMRAALAEAGHDLDRLCREEPDAALGNGGLGRLAACFMDSMASLDIDGYGYGIRYEHGLFRQLLRGGEQVEWPETWLERGNPWEFFRPEIAYPIGFGGSVVQSLSADGTPRGVWEPAETVQAQAYDMPLAGLGGQHAITLRLWWAKGGSPINLDAFNRGDHVGAMNERAAAEGISRVLYPGDETAAGLELRLRQEYFFASAALQDIVRRHLRDHRDLRSLPEHVAIQLNDTHPAIGIAELMRQLVDQHGLEWQDAWSIVTQTCSYTNHTLLPEALETWPVSLMERLLPRHMQIIYLINARHLERVQREHSMDERLLASVSLIAEGHERRVRMAHLAFVGSHTVNGVSGLHTDLMKQTIFADLERVCGARIVNQTNGISFRRWLHYANPPLTRLLVETIGPAVLRDPERLEALLPFAEDGEFRARFAAQRRASKATLARLIQESCGVSVDPGALFDVHIKRIHEYKRQFLNILQTIAAYQAIRDEPGADWVPRVKIFAGKAAPSYRLAKQLIRLALDVARVINADPAVRGLLRIAFIPNYNVSLAEQIIPAADLSEQISTAGMEASGTGNMKLALNGALTIGTFDGANVEISERVGREAMFIFGLSAAEVAALWREGFQPRRAIEASPALARALAGIAAGDFSADDPGRYRGLVAGLSDYDRFLVTADFDAYRSAQEAVDARWREPQTWWRDAVRNTAKMGWFSSDRTIRSYASQIWRMPLAAKGNGSV